jgi:hypothetical protein
MEHANEIDIQLTEILVLLACRDMSYHSMSGFTSANTKTPSILGLSFAGLQNLKQL